MMLDLLDDRFRPVGARRRRGLAHRPPRFLATAPVRRLPLLRMAHLAVTIIPEANPGQCYGDYCDLISYAWLQQPGLPTDASAVCAVSDGNGHNNWQEWRCRPDSTNSLSVLQMLSVANAVSGVTESWQSVAGVSYALERCTDLAGGPRLRWWETPDTGELAGLKVCL